MYKLLKKILMLALVLSLFGLGVLLADKQHLKNELVRLHVVANSDSDEDQYLKLRVRDALLVYIAEQMPVDADARLAKEYLNSRLSELEDTANGVLAFLGSSDRAKVTLTKEEFGVREYDTFTLPSGVYESLRVEIGEASGKNWWCVVFPSLCVGTSVEEFKDTAASSGFHDNLTNTLAKEEGYQVRFFFLDCLGKLENFFHRK